MKDEDEYKDSLFIFNDNEEDYLHRIKTGKKSSNKEGNAAIRDYKNAFGIPTGKLTKPKSGYASLKFKNTMFTAKEVIDTALLELKGMLQQRHYPKVIYSWDNKNKTLGTNLFAPGKEVTDYIYMGIDTAVEEANNKIKPLNPIKFENCNKINNMLSTVLPVQYVVESKESLLTLDSDYVVLEIETTELPKYVSCNPNLIDQMQYTNATQLAKPAVVNSVANANVLFHRYNTYPFQKLYSPPDWSLKSVGSEEWNIRASSVVTFCHAYSDIDEVEQVVQIREPVNIGMSQHFDGINKAKMKSGYRSLYETYHRLGPNFALYMLAKIKTGDGDVMAHVINSIGFAFDNENQPDQKYFLTPTKLAFKENKEIEFKTALYDMFRLIFACAQKNNLPKICLCYIGGAAFAENFLNDVINREGVGSKKYMPYFMEALKKALTNALLTHRITKISMVGKGLPDPNDVMKEVNTAMTQLLLDKQILYEFEGRIPEIVTDAKKDTLFVNAWDPHSVVGNGNDHDDSIDGFFGRNSDMGYMSYPEINPFVLHNILRI